MAGAEVPRPDDARRARVADAILYAVVAAALAFALTLPVSLALGGGLVGVKVALFVVGFFQLALAVVRLWPRDPEDLAVETPDTRTDETTFQRAVQRLLPDDLSIHPRHRVATPYRRFLAGLVTLAVSLVMEQVFGVVA